jgi:hypothetical protein
MTMGGGASARLSVICSTRAVSLVKAGRWPGGPPTLGSHEKCLRYLLPKTIDSPNGSRTAARGAFPLSPGSGLDAGRSRCGLSPRSC